MYKHDWNYLKWKLPDTFRKTIMESYEIRECYHNTYAVSPSKKYDLFKLITQDGKEISMFCKNTTDYEMKMHRKIWELIEEKNCFAKVPKCFGFWKNRLFMEHLDESITLEEFLNSNYTARELETILEQLGSFLAVLHNNMLLHKDLNLNNVLYSPKNMHIHVIDFELSEEKLEKNTSEDKIEMLSIIRKLTKYISQKDVLDIFTNSYFSNLETPN